MLEVLVLVLFVIILFLLAFAYFSHRDRILLGEAEKNIVSAKESLLIAERKFMQGKIKKNVFDSLVEDLEEEVINSELILFRSQKAPVVVVEPKVSELTKKLTKPTKFRKARIEHILKETELLREEMSLLEAKLLKREIRQSVFERLIKEKELILIRKEKELMDIVASSKPKEFVK